MERVFADTSYWIALLNTHDSLHTKAIAASRGMDPRHIVTSEMVLTEFLNSFSEAGPHMRKAAAKITESLQCSLGVIVLPQTSHLFARSLRRYQEMADKGWSLTDCASFLIMEDEHLMAALTPDQHFAQAGFQALLR